MKNMELYEKFREVPESAKKKITGGRLNGKTDINPMWRIKKLTEEFGPAGKGWYAPITSTWTEQGAQGEVTANVRINLFVKYGEEWSMPIEGIGGSVLIAKESGGLRTDDDAYKKAYTDAISVACKALGIGADVYYEKDDTKYTVEEKPKQAVGTQGSAQNRAKTQEQGKYSKKLTRAEMVQFYGVRNVEQTIEWFEDRFQVPFDEWGQEECEMARLKLAEKKRKREAEERAKAQAVSDEDIPFPMGEE